MADTNENLRVLHDKMAEEFVDMIQNGTTVVDKEGEVHKVPMSAAHFAVALALLKHNNITAIAGKNKGAMSKLVGAISDMPIPGADVQKVLHDSAE